jgi:putative ABC transport system permease protein
VLPADRLTGQDLTPKTVSALLIGLKNRAAVFSAQRFVSEFEGEPLMAILPGVALDELWDVVGLGERGLFLMSLLVSLVSLAGLVAVICAGLEQRRRELSILRAVGAGPLHILYLLALEGVLVTLCGVVLGVAVCMGLIAALGAWVTDVVGITLHFGFLSPVEWALLGGVLLAGMVASLVPGWRAYRLSLADGLSPRV